MITVKVYGLYRAKTDLHEFGVEAARDITALLKVVSERTGIPEKEWRAASIFVNGQPMKSLRMFRTRLTDGDEVALLSPASGG